MTNNIRRVIDLIKRVQLEQDSTVLYLIDAEKAFDRLEWGFIKNLKKCNFGMFILQWIDLLTLNKRLLLIWRVPCRFNVSRGTSGVPSLAFAVRFSN